MRSRNTNIGSPQKPSRRTVIAAVLSGTVASLAGCSQVESFTGNGDDSGSGTEVGSEDDPSNAEFTTTYQSADQQLSVQYDGGASLIAGNVQFRTNYGTQVNWPEIGTTGADPDEELSPGSTAILGPEVINWGQPVSESSTVKLIYVREGALTTITEFSPSTTTPTEESSEDPTESPTGETSVPAAESAWRVQTGTWQFEDGQITQRAGSYGNVAYIQNPQVQNGRLEADVSSLDGKSGQNIIYRGDGEARSNYYQFGTGGIGKESPTVSLRVFNGGGSPRTIRSKTLSETPLDIEPGEFHRLKAEFSGQNHRCYVNDELIFEVRDGTHVSRGGIGIHCGSNTKYRNVRYSEF